MSANELKGKRILFIGQKFYDYHNVIIKQLNDFGAEVVFYENRFHQCDYSSSTSKLLSFCSLLFKGDTKKKYQEYILKQVSHVQFDIVFVIGGFSMSKEFISKLKCLNPNAKTILFLWDSLYYRKYSGLIGSFDDCFTFDKVDSVNYGINYLPDFYLKEYENTTNEYKYHLSHIGSVHIFALHRIDVLERIKEQLDALGLPSYLTLYVPSLFRSFKSYFVVPIKFCFDSLYRKFVWRVYIVGSPLITRNRISFDQVDEIESQSLAIVDLPPLMQKGHSIRAITCIASGKKLLTTNAMITQEDFFNSNNIQVLDIDNPIIDIQYWSNPPRVVNISNLLLKNWLLFLIK